MDSNARLTTRVLGAWPEVSRLADKWDDMLAASRADSVYLSWAWISTWQEAFGRFTRPLFVVAEDESGRLLGAAPLYHTSMRLAGLAPYRALRVCGDYRSGAEYPDWPARAERDEEIVRALAAALVKAGGWDCLWMPRVSGWSGARDRLVAGCRAAGLRVHERKKPFSAFELPASFDAYLASLSGNARSMVKRRRKKSVESGAAFEALTLAADRGPYVEALFALNDQRWTETGLAGSFRRKPAEAQFFRLFSEAALSRGWLRMYAARVQGAFVAIQAGYVYGRVYHQFQEGFDPQAEAGLGNALRAYAIEQLIAEGAREYDFLGGFTEHKRRWLAQERVGHDLFIGRRSAKNALLFTRPIWPSGRYIRERHPLEAYEARLKNSDPSLAGGRRGQ